MNKISIISKIENGSPKRNRSIISDAFASFEGKEIKITIERKRKVRSNPQNAYYYGVVVELLKQAIRKEWGEIWNSEKCHELLKNRFLYFEKINEDTGEIIKLPKSTTECTTSEFEDYMTECREFLLEWFGVTVPLPNEQISLI